MNRASAEQPPEGTGATLSSANPPPPGERFVRYHWSQSGEDIVLARIFRDRPNGFYVDVGAHHPRLYSNTHMLRRDLGWRGINVDATREKLKPFRRDRADDVNICALVGTGSRRYNFAVRTDSGLRNRALRESNNVPDDPDAEIRSLKTVTLESILSDHLPPGRQIDLLNIDCEGLDLDVLQSNDWNRFVPEVVCVEDFAVRALRRSPIRRFMRSLGYGLISHCYDTSMYGRASRSEASNDTAAIAPK